MEPFLVAEKFVSINGEGTKAGELALFLRFCGCNLNCSFCDTRWANRKETPCEKATARQLADLALSEGVKNVTLTGGEPLLQKSIGELVSLLGELGFEVEIETNGSVPIRELASLPNRPVFTMDYKLPGSGMEQEMDLENLCHLTSKDTVKFVVGSRQDLERAWEIACAHRLVSRCHVYISPVFGKISPETMVDFMKEKRWNGVRMQLQLHKYIWDPNKRGV